MGRAGGEGVWRVCRRNGMAARREGERGREGGGRVMVFCGLCSGANGRQGREGKVIRGMRKYYAQ